MHVELLHYDLKNVKFFDSQLAKQFLVHSILCISIGVPHGTSGPFWALNAQSNGCNSLTFVEFIHQPLHSIFFHLYKFIISVVLF